jgi:hypothetical protein
MLCISLFRYLTESQSNLSSVRSRSKTRKLKRSVKGKTTLTESQERYLTFKILLLTMEVVSDLESQSKRLLFIRLSLEDKREVLGSRLTTPNTSIQKVRRVRVSKKKTSQDLDKLE